MSSVEGTGDMSELNRRRKILEAPIGQRVEHFADLWKRHDDETTPEELVPNIQAELYVVGATIVSDVLSALVRGADALESLAKDSRAHARASSVSSFTDGEKP